MKTLTTDPIAQATLMIRAPARRVYDAFVDPAVTTRFWFTDSTGPLEIGARVRWSWAMYGAGADVEIKALEPGRRIVFEWDNAGGRTTVEWLFAPLGEGETQVSVIDTGFQGDGDQIVAQALNSQGGFNIVLCAAKIWLEHGIEPNFVLDHAPEHHVKS